MTGLDLLWRNAAFLDDSSTQGSVLCPFSANTVINVLSEQTGGKKSLGAYCTLVTLSFLQHSIYRAEPEHEETRGNFGRNRFKNWKQSGKHGM